MHRLNPRMRPVSRPTMLTAIVLNAVAVLILVDSVSANPPDYLLPWNATESVQVTQDWSNCPGSHCSGINEFAYDFGMFEAPVRASRAGYVAYAWDKEVDSSCGPAGTPGNYVTINHSDGKASVYLHLKYQSLAVKVGDNVPKVRISVAVVERVTRIARITCTLPSNSKVVQTM